jgi:hypothetical protein
LMLSTKWGRYDYVAVHIDSLHNYEVWMVLVTTFL